MTFVRAIKGAPASILWAFLVTRRVMTALELQQWTGYKGDNITVAVRLLVDLGWLSARSPRGPWCLVEGRQLPLMDDFEKVDQITRGDSDLIGVGATTTTIKLTDLKNKSELTVVAADSGPATPIKSDSPGLGLAALETEEQKAIWRICKKFTVGEPTRTRIARETDYPPAHILAHFYFGANDGLDVGLIIHRIRSKDWLPEILKVQARADVGQYYDKAGESENE